ncbi:MAG: hypothetical protein V3U65_15645 [Granulosicoccaceae bacterium]
MASLLHSTITFTTPEPTSDQYDVSANTAEYVSANVIPALVTSDLLHPGNSVFAELIGSHIAASDTQLLILAEDKAVAANPQLPATIDQYFAAHPSLNYFDSLISNAGSLNTISHTANKAKQLVLAFGSQKFLNAVSQTGLPCIAVATRSQSQSITDYDVLTQWLQNKEIAAHLLCVCFDSRLIISNAQYDRSTWVVRGIQHSVFHDSQMFHWIEGNFHQILGEDRTVIDRLFVKVIDKLLAAADQSSTENHLHTLFVSLWSNQQLTANIGLSGYAQAMTTTLLLCIRYAVQVEVMEEGLDARVLFLLKQIVWISPSNVRRLQASRMLQQLPVLAALGKYEFKALDNRAMKNAEVWLSDEVAKPTSAA